MRSLEHSKLKLAESHASLLTHLAGKSPARLAESVMRLSNHYVSNPEAVSPWNEAWAREALLAYYHPLNQARARGVATRTDDAFFSGLSHLVDVGCGTAAASLGFLMKANAAQRLTLLDTSSEILELARSVVEGIPSARDLSLKTINGSLESLHLFDNDLPQSTLAIFSYVLTEENAGAKLEKILSVNPKLEAVAVMEPSTSQDGRKLQRLRDLFWKHGYHIWAPCTHTESCPLLKDSDRDWCHDRIHPELPSWWLELESNLPIKNKTITVSYLLARKTQPRVSRPQVRVIGDMMFEKTKVRQLICRGENREFISWFPSRLGKVADGFELERGDRFNNTPEIWTDKRGADRATEFRLGEAQINQIRASLIEPE